MQSRPEPPTVQGQPLELGSFHAARVDAIVFGATGGIGSELVAELADCPQVRRVFATSRARRGIAAVRETRGEVIQVRFDPSGEGPVAFAEQLHIHEAAPRIVLWAGGLLHHPGIEQLPERRLAHVSLPGLEETFLANTFGPLIALREVVPLLARRERCLVGVLSARVGSISDNRLGGWYSYRASKAATHQIVRTAAIELARSHPQSVCLSLHPGTVDTPLSEPFQSGVRHEVFSPEAVARRLLELLDTAEIADSGGAFAWDGEPIPW